MVMTMSVVMYKRLGISNTGHRPLHQLAVSALGHQAAVEPARGHHPHQTLVGGDVMQFLVAVRSGAHAFSVPGSQFFRWSLFLFWIMAFASATHDIAADGFYMLSLSKHEQAWWVGLRSTFTRRQKFG